MPTPDDRLPQLEPDDLDSADQRGRGWTTTLLRTVMPLRGARENAHEGLLECRARSAQQRAALAGLIPAPRQSYD